METNEIEEDENFYSIKRALDTPDGLANLLKIERIENLAKEIKDTIKMQYTSILNKSNYKEIIIKNLTEKLAKLYNDNLRKISGIDEELFKNDDCLYNKFLDLANQYSNLNTAMVFSDYLSDIKNDIAAKLSSFKNIAESFSIQSVVVDNINTVDLTKYNNKTIFFERSKYATNENFFDEYVYNYKENKWVRLTQPHIDFDEIIEDCKKLCTNITNNMPYELQNTFKYNTTDYVSSLNNNDDTITINYNNKNFDLKINIVDVDHKLVNLQDGSLEPLAETIILPNIKVNVSKYLSPYYFRLGNQLITPTVKIAPIDHSCYNCYYYLTVGSSSLVLNLTQNHRIETLANKYEDYSPNTYSYYDDFVIDHIRYSLPVSMQTIPWSYNPNNYLTGFTKFAKSNVDNNINYDSVIKQNNWHNSINYYQYKSIADSSNITKKIEIIPVDEYEEKIKFINNYSVSNESITDNNRNKITCSGEILSIPLEELGDLSFDFDTSKKLPQDSLSNARITVWAMDNISVSKEDNLISYGTLYNANIIDLWNGYDKDTDYKTVLTEDINYFANVVEHIFKIDDKQVSSLYLPRYTNKYVRSLNPLAQRDSIKGYVEFSLPSSDLSGKLIVYGEFNPLDNIKPTIYINNVDISNLAIFDMSNGFFEYLINPKDIITISTYDKTLFNVRIDKYNGISDKSFSELFTNTSKYKFIDTNDNVNLIGKQLPEGFEPIKLQETSNNTKKLIFYKGCEVDFDDFNTNGLNTYLDGINYDKQRLTNSIEYQNNTLKIQLVNYNNKLPYKEDLEVIADRESSYIEYIDNTYVEDRSLYIDDDSQKYILKKNNKNVNKHILKYLESKNSFIGVVHMRACYLLELTDYSHFEMNTLVLDRCKETLLEYDKKFDKQYYVLDFTNIPLEQNMLINFKIPDKINWTNEIKFEADEKTDEYTSYKIQVATENDEPIYSDYHIIDYNSFTDIDHINLTEDGNNIHIKTLKNPEGFDYPLHKPDYIGNYPRVTNTESLLPIEIDDGTNSEKIKFSKYFAGSWLITKDDPDYVKRLILTNDMAFSVIVKLSYKTEYNNKTLTELITLQSNKTKILSGLYGYVWYIYKIGETEPVVQIESDSWKIA